MYCRFCGNQLPDDSGFCSKCGKKLAEEPAAEDKESSVSFDDELEEIEPSDGGDDFDTEDNDKPAPRSTPKKPRGKAPGPSRDTDRVMRENGSNNNQFWVENGTRVYGIDGETLALLTGRLDGGSSEVLISNPVQSFKLGTERGHIFYTTPDGAMYTQGPDGGRQMIAGTNGDQVAAYCLNRDHLFILLVGRKGGRTLYQLDQKRMEPKIIRSQGRVKPYLSADDKYLYYILQSDDVNKSSLVQYDIAAGTERVIFSGVGIHEATCYRSYVLVSTYKNFISKTQDVELLLIEPKSMKKRKIADVAADQLNCYLDHVFYVDANTRKLWLAPLIPNAGKPHLIWDMPVVHYEACVAILHIWGPNDQDPRQLPLMGEDAFQLGDQGMTSEERDSLRYNAILLEKPDFYEDMDLDYALDYIMAECDLDEEVFDYVAFLTKPQFNKRKENVSALLAAANYPAQRKPGSEPILFVDTTLFHSRSKGFVVATDGIYTKSKGFMLFDQTFTCEQEGIQNLDACLWRNDRFDDRPRRTLKLDVALSRSKLDDVAGLIEAVFAFSYFRKPAMKVDYTFPVPLIEVPPYIEEKLEAKRPPVKRAEPKTTAPTTKESSKPRAPKADTARAPKESPAAAKEMPSKGPTPGSEIRDIPSQKKSTAPPVRQLPEDKETLAKKRSEAQKLTGLVAAGWHHTSVLRTDGTVLSVGDNTYGQTNTAPWFHIKAVAAPLADHFTVGLKQDGRVVATGLDLSGQCNVETWRDIIAISAGGVTYSDKDGTQINIGFTIGLHADGTVIATGCNRDGQCDVSKWTGVTAISAGGWHCVGLLADGTVVAAGTARPQACDVGGWTDIVAISAGGEHTVGLKADGTVVAVGNNAYGQCDVEQWNNIIAIAAGGFHTIGLRSDGTVLAAGKEEHCAVRDWSGIAAICAGGFHTIGIGSDGQVIAAGANTRGQCDMPSIKLFGSLRTLERDRQIAVQERKTFLQSEEKRLQEELSALQGLSDDPKRQELQKRLAAITAELAE